MRKQQQELQQKTTNLSELADPIDRLAAMLADVSTELGHLSEQLRTQRTGLESVRRPDPDREPEEQPPTAPETQGLTMGEPVDTSFVEPTQTPAAEAAGALPSKGLMRWAGSQPHVVAWVASAVALLGFLLLILILAQL